MIRPSLGLRQQMRDAIRNEIDQRTALHQANIARLKSGGFDLAMDVTGRKRPLVLLAHGDSWFDYPLDGNGISLKSTDIVAQLGSMGDMPPLIHNVSHYGDATTEEMSIAKQERLIQSLQDPRNWGGNGPDAILFSGGGNDIAGNQFCIYLNCASDGPKGLNDNRFAGVLASVQASYLDLFAFRDKYAKRAPIFAHCYDFPVPNGVHPACAGPWLKPGLDYCGWTVSQGTEIVREALTEFKSMLEQLEADPKNKFILVRTQGTLSLDDWANELHPYPNGFKKLSQCFLDALNTKFPAANSAAGTNTAAPAAAISASTRRETCRFPVRPHPARVKCKRY